MSIFHAVVLGVVQGLGEFLPISSSAHLVLVPWLFGWPDPGLAFDVALHLGTLVAVVAYFWRDWLQLLRAALTGGSGSERRLFWSLVVATIPGAATGLLLESYAETAFRNPLLIGLMLVVMGLVLYWADHRTADHQSTDHRTADRPAYRVFAGGARRASGKDLRSVGVGDALLIGLSQALAIIPGVSRSGATISAARLLGFNREAATRFSFLLSTPIIVGAGLKQLLDLSPADITGPFIAGVASAAVVGFAAIAFLLRFVTLRSFNAFVWYRVVLGAVIISLALQR